MNYAAAVASGGGTPPSKDNIRYLIAHFQGKVKMEDLILQIGKISKISPCGVDKHHSGALLAFKSQDDLTKVVEATKGSLKVGPKIINLTTLDITTPVASRGRRWRMSRVPFWASQTQITELLAASGLTVTALKFETVKGHPAVRTAYASFWTKETDKVSPKSITLDGAKMLVFDPTKPAPKPAAASQKPDAQAPSSPLTKTAAREEPQTPTVRAFTSHADQLVLAPETPEQQDESPSKKRKFSPLQNHPPKPPIKSFLEEPAPTVTPKYIAALGLPLPESNSTLSIYEDIVDKSHAVRISKQIPSPIGKVKKTTLTLDHKEGGKTQDWFILSSMTEKDPDDFVLENAYSSLAYEVTDNHFVRMGWLQRVTTDKGIRILVIFKSRIAFYQDNYY